MTESQAILLTVILAPMIPIGLIYLISRHGGWYKLADSYPLQEDFPPPSKRFGYGAFRRWIGYNGAIILASNSKGLYLRATPVLLSYCHSPIFIPWSEITKITPPPSRWDGFRIHTRRASEVEFALMPGTFAAIKGDANRAGVPGQY